MKKKVTAPLSYDPGKGRPKEHLAYLNWQEMQQLQRLNGGNMEFGPRGLPSFPPADAKGSSSKASSSSSRSSGGGGRDSGQAAARSSGSSKSSGSSYGGGGRDSGSKGGGGGAAPKGGVSAGGGGGGGGRDSGAKGNVGMGKAPSAAKAPSYGGGGRDTGRAAPKPSSAATSGVRSISRVTPSYSPPRAALQAVRRGAGSISGTMLGNNDPVAQTRSLQAITNAVNERYGTSYSPGQISEFSRAIAGEAAGENRFGRAAVANTMFNRISLAQEDPKKYGYMGGTSPEKLMSKYDATGLREGTKPNSAYKSAVPGTPSFQAGLTAIADAVSPLSEFSQTATPRVLNATHYYNPKDANPKWGARSGREFQQVGGHLFGNDEQSEKAVSSVRSKVSQPAPTMTSAAPGVPIPQIKPFNDPSRFKLKDPNILDNVNPVALTKLIRLQEQYGAPLTITSGHRNPLLNKQVGGAERSQHIPGNAIDIKTPGASAEDTARLIREASSVGFTGIGGYRSGAIHVDVGNKRVWSPDSAPKEIKEALRGHSSGAIPKSKIDYAALESRPSTVRVVPASSNAQASGPARMSPVAQLALQGAVAAGKVLGSPSDYKIPSIKEASAFTKNMVPDSVKIGYMQGEAERFGRKIPSYVASGVSSIGRGIAGAISDRGSVQQASSEAPSEYSDAQFQPYGMTYEQQQKYQETEDRKNKFMKGAAPVAGIASPVPLVGLGLNLANKAIDKAAEAKINKYVASSPAERAEQERKDPSLIGWARVIGVQPQSDYSVYQNWAEERGLRGPGESRGERQGDQGDIRYAGGVGALPTATTPIDTSTTPPPTSGRRPYQYYQWDVGVNIPSPGDPNYTSYQEYLSKRTQPYQV